VVKLKQIYVGKADGKKEALYKEDFENYFYNYNDIYNQTLEPDKYLVLGKKGTGKTILGEYINKQAQYTPLWFSKTCSYKDFKFHELKNLTTNDIQPNEYLAIWEWIMLIELARLLLTDENISYSKEKESLRIFIQDNFGNLKLNVNKIIEITKSKKLRGGISLFKLSKENGSSTKSETGYYLDYLEDLRETVISLLEGSDSRYTLIYDELDDRFRNNDLYKHSIISLIKATDKLNLTMYESKIKCKVILLLRTDIFMCLNDPDLNKVEQDNSIVIDWGNNTDKYSPLIELILVKVKKSIPELEVYNNKDLFKLLFPNKVKGEFPERFLLSRTLFRPRDVITYLNIIINKYPEHSCFGWQGFKTLEKNYSQYLLKEVRNELCGHVSNEVIDDGLLLLKQFKKITFYYNEIKEYFEARKSLYKHIDLEDTLKLFFDFNILGNRYMTNNRTHSKHHYSWAYRENATIDFDKEFVIHKGLRKGIL
jgi:hypothetical protein